MVTCIRKRDGTLVRFDRTKITEALWNAAQSVGGTDREESERLSALLVTQLEKLPSLPLLTVEQIQDKVEQLLILEGHSRTAKSYILYRKQHEHLRSRKKMFFEVQRSMHEYLDQTDWRVHENSNSDYSFSGLMFHIASKVVANYTLSHVYSERVSQAHRNADIHIHDLGVGIIAYCCGWSLKQLLTEGFGGVSKKIRSRPPRHLDVAVNQMVNFLGTMQLEHAGAQAFSSVDTLLAPFVKKDELSYDAVKQCIQMLVFSLNVPSRWGCQAPFTNFTFDWIVPDDLCSTPALVGGVSQDFTYGDCQPEMEMINKAFIEIMLEGDADGRTFFYPIPTYNITKDFNWDSPNAQLLFEMTAKYGTPYFQNFINSDLNPSDIRSMCCRLQLDLKELRNKMGGLFGAGDQTGSIGVVTINLPRVALLSTDADDFFSRLDIVLDICKESLETKRALVERNLKQGLIPFTQKFLGGYGNHFSTIGINGMHEALHTLFGYGIDSSLGKSFAVRVLKHLRGKLSCFQEETGHLYNLEATPCESATYRFAKKDKELFPSAMVSGTTERPYYTNSTHLPVHYTADVFEALQHQDELQMLYTGGTVLHCFLGERLTDWRSSRALVRKIAEQFKLPYFTLTPTFSICPQHGYISGEHYSCPFHELGGEHHEVQQKNRSLQQDCRVLSSRAELERGKETGVSRSSGI